MRSASLGTPSECDGMALFQRGSDASFGGDGAAPRCRSGTVPMWRVGAGRIEHALAECAGETLFGAEQHERRPGSIGAPSGRAAEGPAASARPMAAAIVAA